MYCSLFKLFTMHGVVFVTCTSCQSSMLLQNNVYVRVSHLMFKITIPFFKPNLNKFWFAN